MERSKKLAVLLIVMDSLRNMWVGLPEQLTQGGATFDVMWKFSHGVLGSGFFLGYLIGPGRAQKAIWHLMVLSTASTTAVYVLSFSVVEWSSFIFMLLDAMISALVVIKLLDSEFLRIHLMVKALVVIFGMRLFRADPEAAEVGQSGRNLAEAAPYDPDTVWVPLTLTFCAVLFGGLCIATGACDWVPCGCATRRRLPSERGGASQPARHDQVVPAAAEQPHPDRMGNPGAPPQGRPRLPGPPDVASGTDALDPAADPLPPHEALGDEVWKSSCTVSTDMQFQRGRTDTLESSTSNVQRLW